MALSWGRVCTDGWRIASPLSPRCITRPPHNPDEIGSVALTVCADVLFCISNQHPLWHSHFPDPESASLDPIFPLSACPRNRCHYYTDVVFDRHKFVTGIMEAITLSSVSAISSPAPIIASSQWPSGKTLVLHLHSPTRSIQSAIEVIGRLDEEHPAPSGRFVIE